MYTYTGNNYNSDQQHIFRNCLVIPMVVNIGVISLQYKNIKSMSIQEINPLQLQQWYQQQQKFILLDVREDDEVELVTLPDSLHIPMNLIPIRQNEIPDDKPIVLYCHHGMRSMQVALYLQEAGFEDLYNLSGGIDAWSLTVDPSLPRY